MVFCGLPLLVAPVRAQIVTLSDLNSSAQINTQFGDLDGGMFNWSVDGINQLGRQWFWYAIGPNTNQLPINTLGAPTVVTPNAATAHITYHGGLITAQVNYVSTGGAMGSRSSALNESVHVVNTSNETLPLRFYQYSDFNLIAVTRCSFTGT